MQRLKKLLLIIQGYFDYLVMTKVTNSDFTDLSVNGIKLDFYP